MTTISDRSKFISFYRSTIGRKIITGITGLGLSLFVLVHALGNLTILAGSKTYNQLAHGIDSLGIGLNIIELVLLGLIVLHVAIGIKIRLNSQQARPVGYKELKSAGEPSKQSFSSRSMLITGIVLLGFVIWHLATFKFGTYYTTVIEGTPMRNLSRLVIEKFQNPIYAFGYSGIMILLGIHLRHGLWSAWQSIGMLNTKISPLVYAIALVMAVAISSGFILIPVAIYFGWLG